MRRILPLLLAPALLATGCSGPDQKAGREKDKADAAASGVAYAGNGPNEQIGEAKDRAADAANDARNAQAAALREQARTMKAQADIEAERLEQQAKTVREQAKSRAAPLEAQAKTVRDAH